MSVIAWPMIASMPQIDASRSPIVANILLMSERERPRSESESDWSALEIARTASGQPLD